MVVMRTLKINYNKKQKTAVIKFTIHTRAPVAVLSPFASQGSPSASLRDVPGTETDAQTLKTTSWLPEGAGAGRDGLGVWDRRVLTAVYGMDGQQGSAVQHRLHPILGDHLCGKRI